MDKAKKNTVIHAAADRMAANYKSSQIPMYGDALRMPNRNAVIEIIRDCQKLIFPVYYGDRDLLKLPPEQYSALLMEHIHEKLTRQITLTMPECDENCEVRLCDQHGIHRAHPCHSGAAAQGPVGEL